MNNKLNLDKMSLAILANDLKKQNLSLEDLKLKVKEIFSDVKVDGSNKEVLKIYHEFLIEILEPYELVAPAIKTANSIDELIIGEYAIIRTNSAGVHVGFVIEREGMVVALKDSRRMYYWSNLDDGISLSHIAINGIAMDSKIQRNLETNVLESIEIIPVTSQSKATFDIQPYAKAE